MTDAIMQLSVADILKLYRKKSLSPVEVTQSCLKQIIKYNPVLNALCFMDERATLHQARRAEKKWMKGEQAGLLEGIPVTIKDWFHVKGWPTRQGSKTSSHLPQPEDSPPVARLREEGAIFIGKTTLPEYGHKGVTHSPLTGITRNPWNIEKTCGGSSGGAAVAAATGMAFLNLGSDAGGSIRIPASFSGVLGFKPSPGLVPSWPPSLFSTLSAAGPLTRSVEDAALMMDVLAKPDARDWHALPLPPPSFTGCLQKPLGKLKIAWAPQINGIGPVPAVAEVIGRKITALQALGTVEEIALKVPELTETFSSHWMAVASYIVAQFTNKQKKDVDPRFLDWARRGDALRLHDYLAAEYARMTIGAQLKDLLTTYDILVTPTTAMAGFAAGADMPFDAKGKPWEDWTPFTYPANLAKLPAASLPLGMTADGLPAGLQIMAGYLKDTLVLQASKRLEEALGFKGWLSQNDGG